MDEDAAAFAHRSAPYILNVNARWERPAEAARNVAWARDVWDAMQPCSAGGDVRELPRRGGRAAGPRRLWRRKYERLVALKRRYDPGNAFRVNQNIAPASGRGRFDRA